jgi:putative ATPase
MSHTPLALKLAPKKLEDVVGQEHILGPGKMLSRLIQTDTFSSLIFHGPPGTGKTSLAKVIANTTKADFQAINATTAGKADMKKIIDKAIKLRENGDRTVMFVDEIHRFNKAQQDYLLPYTENGTVILIGATTENPYFEVNGALLSRSTIFELKPLSFENIRTLVIKAVYDKKVGMGDFNAVIYNDAADFLADLANGDARRALNAVELGVLTTDKNPDDGKIHYTLEVAKESIQKRVIRYDKGGDQHYDTISAFIKSMRGSDPDATLYYLARMLYAGEDVKYIARRIMIHASEDVGMADPMALCVATNAFLAVDRVGMPEAQIILAQAALHVAMAPKSPSSCVGIGTAMALVKETGNLDIPPHLQDSHYKSASKLGRGVGYAFPHDYPNHWVEQQYLPDMIAEAKLYEPSESGFEKQIAEYHKSVTGKQ